MADISIVEASRFLHADPENTFDKVLRLIPRGKRDEITERAAIMEIDGRLSRAEAEQSALESWGRAKQGKKIGFIN